MTLHEVVTNLMNRPDLVGVLEPDMIISVDRNGMLRDETKSYKAYPRFRAQACMAITWQALSRGEVQRRADEMAQELRERGVLNDNG